MADQLETTEREAKAAVAIAALADVLCAQRETFQHRIAVQHQEIAALAGKLAAAEAVIAELRGLIERIEGQNREPDDSARNAICGVEQVLGSFLEEQRRQLRQQKDELLNSLAELRTAFAEIRSASAPSNAPAAGEGDDYPRMVERCRKAVGKAVPKGSRLLVFSKGDGQLLAIDDVRAEHFPQDTEGRYAGYYPADGSEAVARLVELWEDGAEYVALPATSFWWLDHYPELRDYLEDKCRLLLSDNRTCAIYALPPTARVKESSFADPRTSQSPQDRQRELCVIRDLVRRLLPSDAVVGVVNQGDTEFLRLGATKVLPFLGSGDSDSNGPPAGDDDASTCLESLRGQGAEYLVLPASAFWWLDHYPGFGRYLETRFRCVTFQSKYCCIYDLAGPAGGSPRNPRARSIP